MSIWASTVPIDDVEDGDDPPYVYEASHILPDPDGERGGYVDCSRLPKFVRHYRDNPDSSEAPDGIEPWMRLTVGPTGDLILHARHVRALRDCLTEWLDHLDEFVDRAAHHLHLNGDPRFDWRLTCDHEPGGHWATYDDPNDPEPASNECWLRSWWDELDMEMLKDAINVWDGITTVPIPLDVEGDGWGVGPLLVPWKDEADDGAR